MACSVKVTLLSEALSGNIGDDWEYSLDIKVFNPGLTGAGTITVPEHNLKPGTRQQPPGPLRAVTMPAGPCESGPRVELNLFAAEVDLIDDDEQEGTQIVPLECPGLGNPPYSIEYDFGLRVREEPRFLP